MENKGQVLFIPHGGGPLPILGHKGHQQMVSFLKNFNQILSKPSAIIVISAHWEEDEVKITGGENPQLIYDYYGFPDESYKITYPAPGNVNLANKIKKLLDKDNIKSSLDKTRGFDHGVFIPLKLLYPDASIPCVQISLLKGLDPKKHIQIGKALRDLMNEDILIIGSGMSFHNLKILLSSSNISNEEEKNINDFDKWLVKIFTDKKITNNEREKEIINWANAPAAKFCHPREEHLIPLHVCMGIKSSSAKLVFNDKIMGATCSAFLW